MHAELGVHLSSPMMNENNTIFYCVWQYKGYTIEKLVFVN